MRREQETGFGKPKKEYKHVSKSRVQKLVTGARTGAPTKMEQQLMESGQDVPNPYQDCVFI